MQAKLQAAEHAADERGAEIAALKVDLSAAQVSCYPAAHTHGPSRLSNQPSHLSLSINPMIC